MELTTTNLTPELVKNQAVVDLLKAEITLQGLYDADSKIVYNEDNLQAISDHIAKLKKAAKIVEEKRVKEKEPFVKGGKAVDDGIKLLSTPINDILLSASNKYNKLCAEMLDRKNAEDRRKAEAARVMNEMNTAILTYSEKIGLSQTNKELTDIERLMNLDSGNSKKWGEFYDEFRSRLDAIRPQILQRKEILKEWAETNRNAFEAMTDEQEFEMLEKRENLETKLSESSQSLQNTAANQVIQNSVQTVEQVFPEIDIKRTVWDYEVVDINLLQRSFQNLVKIEPDHANIKAFIKTKKSAGTIKEETIGGLRIFKKLSFS